MEKSDRNRTENILEPERAKAWIFTLALIIAVCLGLIIYTLITHNPAINFLDSSLFKPGLVWVGFIGLFSFFVAFLFLIISTSIFRFLPELRQWINITAILGVFLLITAFVLSFISYDIEHKLFRHIGFNCQMAGASMVYTKELIEHKFNKIAKLWHLIGMLFLLAGIVFLAFSFDG